MGSQGSDQDLEAGQGYCGHPVDIRDPRSGGHQLADSFRKKECVWPQLVQKPGG